MQGKILKRAVDALQPGAAAAFLWDSELKGFGVKVTPAGKKLYIFQYRPGGRGTPTKRVTIGQHGDDLPPEKARTIAEGMRGDRAKGVDPAKAKAARKAEALIDAKASTVDKLCDDYLAAVRRGEVLTRGGTTKKASTLDTDESRITRHIKPLMGKLKVRDVTREHVEQFKRDVVAGKTKADSKTKKKRGRSIVRGGRGAATRTLGLLGGIFQWAIKEGIRPDNPVRGIERYADRKGQRYLTGAEIQAIGDALKDAAAKGEGAAALAAIRLLLLTGCRKSEILTLQWPHVDIERACLRLPDSKTGAKVVPLGAAALAVLADLPRVKGNPYVLPGDRTGVHLVGLQKVWERVRKAAGLQDVRLHDLRHGFASIAASGGDSLLIIGGLLGHRDPRTTARYAHLGDHPLKAAADRTSAAIAAALDGRIGKVMPIEGARRAKT